MAEPSAPQPRKRRWLLFYVLIIIGLAVAAGALIWHSLAKIAASTFPYPLLKADAAELKSTTITPHLEAPIVQDKNLLWCSTFQLAWNEACKAAGGDIKMQSEPESVAILNKKTASLSDVAPESCLVMAGWVKDGIVGNIQQKMTTQFHEQPSPDVLNRLKNLPQGAFLEYAYLFRELPFEYPFHPMTEPLVFAQDKKVASFGVRKAGTRMDERRISGQVEVEDYRSADDFVVALRPKDEKELIILAKVAPAETLQKTIEQVHARYGTFTEYEDVTLMPGESIVVPVMNFDLLRYYDELCGKAITTPGALNGMPIIMALQSVRFRLDERGATLKSDASIAQCGNPPVPRQFILDKPFLLLLERAGAVQPYFAMWVENAELLVPYDANK